MNELALLSDAPAPVAVDDAEAFAQRAEEAAIGNAFLDRIRTEMQKNKPSQPEPPVIDV